jgi:hypothetical protein
VFNKFLGRVNISVFPPWWVEAEKLPSNLSKIEFGRKLILGVADAYLKQVERL